MQPAEQRTTPASSGSMRPRSFEGARSRLVPGPKRPRIEHAAPAPFVARPRAPPGAAASAGNLDVAQAREIVQLNAEKRALEARNEELRARLESAHAENEHLRAEKEGLQRQLAARPEPAVDVEMDDDASDPAGSSGRSPAQGAQRAASLPPDFADGPEGAEGVGGGSEEPADAEEPPVGDEPAAVAELDGPTDGEVPTADPQDALALVPAVGGGGTQEAVTRPDAQANDMTAAHLERLLESEQEIDLQGRTVRGSGNILVVKNARTVIKNGTLRGVRMVFTEEAQGSRLVRVKVEWGNTQADCTDAAGPDHPALVRVDGAKGFSMEYCCVDGGEGENEKIPDGLVVCKSADAAVHSCMFKRCLDGVFADDKDTLVRLTAVICTENGNGARALEARLEVYDRCTFSSNSQSGIFAGVRAQVDMRDASCTKNKGCGVAADNFARVVVEDSDMTENTCSGMFLVGNSSASITRSEFTGNGIHGIYVDTAKLALTRSTLRGNTECGIWSTGRPGSSIKLGGVKCVENQQHGLAAMSGTEVVDGDCEERNVFVNNGEDGIRACGSEVLLPEVVCSGNGGSGVHATRKARVTVGGEMSTNKQHGAYATGGETELVVDNGTCKGNGLCGVHVINGADTFVHNSTMCGNKQFGIQAKTTASEAPWATKLHICHVRNCGNVMGAENIAPHVDVHRE
ncbi:unnamed protein product [Pedinophyceae sp. YPF-701]|nr:unnamed protein product [Pedinophyceae sp. YPF-701]